MLIGMEHPSTSTQLCGPLAQWEGRPRHLRVYGRLEPRGQLPQGNKKIERIYINIYYYCFVRFCFGELGVLQGGTSAPTLGPLGRLYGPGPYTS